jgi:hypothetical protein
MDLWHRQKTQLLINALSPTLIWAREPWQFRRGHETQRSHTNAKRSAFFFWQTKIYRKSVVFCFATGDHAFERSRFVHNAVTRLYRRWRQNIDLSGNPMPPRMTAAREGLGRVHDSVRLQPERSITFLLRSKKRAAQQSVNG